MGVITYYFLYLQLIHYMFQDIFVFYKTFFFGKSFQIAIISFNREKYALSMESLLDCPNKEYSDWHEMEQTMNTNLNNLEVKLTSLEESLSECNQDLEQKQKVFFFFSV